MKRTRFDGSSPQTLSSIHLRARTIGGRAGIGAVLRSLPPTRRHQASGLVNGQTAMQVRQLP